MYKKIRKFDTDIHVLTINPKQHEIILAATEGNKLLTVPNIENKWMIDNGYTRTASINAGFFQGSGWANGWELTDYNYLHTEGFKDGIFDLFYKDGKLIIDDADLTKFNSEYKNKAQWGVTASYCLVRNGKIDLSGSNKFTHSLTYNPRTFIGQRSNGEVLLVVCEGRGKANSKGLTASQQAQVCLDLNCITAINLDGGGSSTFEYQGKIMNTPTDGSLRKVANAIVVYSKEKIADKPIKGEDSLKKIVLDAGHGYNTAGKRTPDDIREWYLNDRVCNFIAEKLKEYDGIETFRTDDTTGKTDIPLLDRVAKCNDINPNLFISIHHNATGSDWVENTTGTEIYWHTKGTQEDKKVANILAPKLAANTGLRNRGVKQEPFTVLGCNATAILSESGFMNSKIDHQVITTWGQEAYANAVVETVVEYLGLIKKIVDQPKPTEPTSNKQYRVVCGTYEDKANAEKVKAELINMGYKGTWLQAIDKQ